MTFSSSSSPSSCTLALDLLDDLLNERQSLHGAINRANILMTRVRIGWGEAAGDILLHELLKEVESETNASFDLNINIDKVTIISNRLDESDYTHTSSLLLTRDQQVQSLRSTYTSLLREYILPFARLQFKFENIFFELLL